jgi:hypothetical protein
MRVIVAARNDPSGANLNQSMQPKTIGHSDQNHIAGTHGTGQNAADLDAGARTNRRQHTCSHNAQAEPAGAIETFLGEIGCNAFAHGLLCADQFSPLCVNLMAQFPVVLAPPV